MSLAHAILGYLKLQPMTGYDLKTQCFDGSVNYFWPADQAQIYRTLDKLHEQGFVECELEVQQDKPNRKVYSITAAGGVELDRWLTTPQDLPIYREPFLIQLFFGAELDNKAILQLMQGQLQKHHARLAEYNRVPLPPVTTPDFPRDHLMARLTLDIGIRLETQYIEWLESAIKIVENWESSSEH